MGSRATHTTMPSARKKRHGHDGLAVCHQALCLVTQARQATTAHPDVRRAGPPSRDSAPAVWSRVPRAQHEHKHEHLEEHAQDSRLPPSPPSRDSGPARKSRAP
eukprot:10729707-Alexandrium_andersonii.AAC.1